MRSLLTLGLLFGFTAVLGCGQSSDAGEVAEPGDEAELVYRMGEPIADSTYAVIVTSEFGADTLTTARFQAVVEQFLAQNPAMQLDEMQQRLLRRSIAEDFVMRHLLSGVSMQQGIVVDTALVVQQMADIQGRFSSQAEFEAALMQQGMDMDSLRGAISSELQMQEYQRSLAESAASPTGEELEAFRQERAQEISAQHILFMTQGADQTTRDSLRMVAASVLDSARAGNDFATLAQRYSDDGSAQSGGDLGYFGRGVMVPPFEEAAFALADSGDVYPELVETRFGYHIIRLTGRRATEPMDSVRAEAMLMRERRQDALEAGLDDLRAKAVIRIQPDIVSADLNEEVSL